MRFAAAAVDVTLAGVILPAVLLRLLWQRVTIRRSSTARGAILHLSSAASTNQVIRKFGSLDFLFEYDGSATQGLFDVEVLCWYPSDETADRRYPQGWRILERRKLAGILSISGLVLAWPWLTRIAALEDVRLIRAWNPYFSGLTAWLLSRVLRVPFCVSVHSDDEHLYTLDGSRGAFTIFGSRPLARRLAGFVLTRARVVMPIRQSIAEAVIRSGVPPSRVRVIPHGIRTEPFRPAAAPDIRSRLGCAPAARIVSFAGRLSRENYIHEMIEAAKLVVARRGDVVFVFAGDGPERETVERAVASLDAARSAIVLTGFLKHDEVIALRCQSFVSLCPMGGFSLIEACAAGRPVVAYDVQWHSELVRNNDTGILVKEHDIAGVAAAIERLLDDPAEADRLGAHAQALAFRRHEMDVTASVKREAYRFALQSRA